jgi:hypothetical protein
MKNLGIPAIGLLLSLMIANAAGFAAEPILTPFQAENLNGKNIAIPAGRRTLILIAFEREQQDDVDSWIDGLDLVRSGLTWYEVPVIDNPGAILRWVITNGMRDGIPDPDRRAHVVTLFANRPGFLQSLAIADLGSCYAMVIDSEGKILTSVFGQYEPQSAKKILSLMTDDSEIR